MRFVISLRSGAAKLQIPIHSLRTGLYPHCERRIRRQASTWTNTTDKVGDGLSCTTTVDNSLNGSTGFGPFAVPIDEDRLNADLLTASVKQKKNTPTNGGVFMPYGALLTSQINRNAPHLVVGGVSVCVRRCPTFPPERVVSSALAGLASGFGMGPGVSLSLCPP